MTFTFEFDGRTVTFTRCPTKRRRGGKRWGYLIPYFQYYSKW